MGGWDEACELSYKRLKAPKATLGLLRYEKRKLEARMKKGKQAVLNGSPVPDKLKRQRDALGSLRKAIKRVNDRERGKIIRAHQKPNKSMVQFTLG